MMVQNIAHAAAKSYAGRALLKAVAEKLEQNKRRQFGAVKDGEPCNNFKN